MKKGLIVILVIVFAFICIGVITKDKIDTNNETNIKQQAESTIDDEVETKEKDKIDTNSAIKTTSDYFNVEPEELIRRYNNNIKNDPDNVNASYGDIAAVSFDSYEKSTVAYKENRNATIYTYFSTYEYSKKDIMGACIMSDDATDNVIWAEIYARNEFLNESSTGKLIQYMFWYLSNAVFPDMTQTEFNGIWYGIASNKKTEYKNFVFMVDDVDGGIHFIITKKEIID